MVDTCAKTEKEEENVLLDMLRIEFTVYGQRSTSNNSCPLPFNFVFASEVRWDSMRVWMGGGSGIHYSLKI